MQRVRLVLFGSILAILLSSSTFNIDLKTMSLLDDLIELKIPRPFHIMSEELIKTKYPSANRPTLVYSNEKGSINIALNHTINPATQELIPAYKENLMKTFKAIYPNAKWKNDGIKLINGKNVGFLELVTPAIDTEIYNLMFFTEVESKLLLCTFNCPIRDEKEWTPIAKDIMNSLKAK